jgi:hypothetical protein
MVAAIINLVMWLAGMFGFGKPPDDAADQRKADKQAGIDAARAAAGEAEVQEIQDAHQSRQASENNHAVGGPDGVRERGWNDPNARNFDPDAVG